jgi:uncharacterized membrane protein (UPF0182 family)
MKDRNLVDIPEAFRRAMEEEGWDGGVEKQGDGRRPPGGASPWWTRRWFWLGGLGMLLLMLLNWLSTVYTEWLWFTNLGYRQVWLKQWGAQVATFALFFTIAAVILLPNWRIAFGRAKQSRRTTTTMSLLALPGVGWLITAAGLLFAAIFAGSAASYWDQLLRYFYRVPFGTADPIFGRDVSFYLFELPVYRFLQNWFLPLLLLALLGVVGLYAATDWRNVQRGNWPPLLQNMMRRHAALLAALFLGVWAAGYWLNIYELLYSRQGVAAGAGYTDLNASLLAIRVEMVVVILLALAVAANLFIANSRLPLILVGVWLVAAVGLGMIYPAIMQRYIVEPNELALERPYITHNIRFTRLGFGLDTVESRPFGSVDELSEDDLAENAAALQNIRVWDYRPLHQTYVQLQGLRPYYQFPEIDIDRYEINGQTRQVMLAGRELNKEQLTGQSWVNQRLEFTHGYGVVMNPVDSFTAEGRPVFFLRDLPPRSTVELEVTRPEIYYGELMEDVVFVNSGLEEFDYPQGNENVYSSYSGQGGVPLTSFVRRLAFALRFGEINLLLSQYITPSTRVMFHRPITESVLRIAPFLHLDHDPYLVVADGRLVWMIDAYTVSDDFPYSQPVAEGFNYIRNPVKITVDAYDGMVNFYLADPTDPIIQSYASALPGLFRPLDEMPVSLQAHIRYPEDLFEVQTRQYLAYHMTDEQVFYNREDLWSIPQEILQGDAEEPMDPYYVFFRLPGEAETEYLLIQPYTPAGKTNMIAWIAARNDPPNYGQLVAYELPKQELILGPSQVEGRINQDPIISQQLSLWDRSGSEVIRGNLIVLPINNSFLYVEPLYLRAENGAQPELKQVILASGNRVVMRPTLNAALAALLTDPGTDVVVSEPPAEDGETTESPPADASLEELIQSANAHFAAAEAAQRTGDWTTYGRELELLRQDLERLQALTAP